LTKWLLEILSTGHLPQKAKDQVTINWLPYSATDIERKTFQMLRARCSRMGGTLENLTEYLER
jgi:hypothetical protein